MSSTKEYFKNYRMSLKMETLSRYGWSCASCGFSDMRALHIDHINNDGGLERKSLGGKHMAGHGFYRILKKNGWPTGYQTLCANCNAIKQWETHG